MDFHVFRITIYIFTHVNMNLSVLTGFSDPVCVYLFFMIGLFWSWVKGVRRRGGCKFLCLASKAKQNPSTSH